MKIINNKRELFLSSEDEIRQYFDSVIFRGQFEQLNENERANTTWACGKVENITIDGQMNELCPQSIWIPNKFQNIKEGMCEFKASVDFRALTADRPQYKLLVNKIKNIEISTPYHDSKKEQLFRRNLKLKDNLFVGQFTINKDGSVTIRDIRQIGRASCRERV